MQSDLLTRYRVVEKTFLFQDLQFKLVGMQASVREEPHLLCCRKVEAPLYVCAPVP
jgi:hypothetical protein